MTSGGLLEDELRFLEVQSKEPAVPYEEDDDEDCEGTQGDPKPVGRRAAPRRFLILQSQFEYCFFALFGVSDRQQSGIRGLSAA